ncbi:MAG: hypothetical protein CMM60_03990 [Rhodospirillaceae bacterium]|nr:hypothetical protein [Rhodospirillaceae bacterium]
MDFFSKIGFAGTYFSFKDAGLFSTEHVVNNKTTDTAIIVSTYYRCLDNDYNFFNTFKLNNGKNASPALFAYALPNAFLGEASIFLKATGQCYAISEDNSDGISVLKLAFDTLNFKESEFVICGICDTNAPEFMKSFLNNTEDIFSGSLFFTISKTKQKYNYGKIREDENGNIFFNEKNIKNLLELAKICIKNKKI